MSCPGIIGRRYLYFCVGDGTGHRTACRSNDIRGGVALLSSRPVNSNMALVVSLRGWHHDGLVDEMSFVMWCLASSASSAYFMHGTVGSHLFS